MSSSTPPSAEFERLCELSASGQSEEILLLIRKNNINVNQANSRGWTPLHFAARFGQKQSAVALIESGSNEKLVDSEGKTPFDFACFWGHEDLAALLKPKTSAPAPQQLGNGLVHTFAGNPLNRLSGKRKDPQWIKQLITDQGTCYLVLSGVQVLLKVGDKKARGPPELQFLKYKQVEEWMSLGATHIFLGLDESTSTPYFALDISSIKSSNPERFEQIEQQLEIPGQSLKPIRPTAFLMTNVGECAMIAQARSILEWNKKVQFCAACGSKTEMAEGGYKRECPKSECLANQGVQNVSYPRTDPVAIAVILSPDRHRCLLGRSKHFPEGFFSCLAGFVEPGESVEEAVRREVFEESAIRVGGVAYHSSQPWPFPSQLMIGCWGEALTEEITVDPEELEEARWFTREEVVKALGKGMDIAGPELKLPPKYAIAHHLLKSWIDNNPPQLFARI